jgi:hypothetical protein
MREGVPEETSGGESKNTADLGNWYATPAMVTLMVLVETML